MRIKTAVVALVALIASHTVQADSYNPTTNQLTIPNITVGSTVYTNVVVNIGSVASVGSAIPIVTPGTTCTPPTSLSASPLAVFQSSAQMSSALTGTWAGCDIYGNAVSVTITGNGISLSAVTGTISKQTNYYATYTNCTYTLRTSYYFPANGQVDFNVTALACAQGNGLDTVHGDVFSIYTQGAAGTISALMLQLDFVNFAMVVKQ